MNTADIRALLFVLIICLAYGIYWFIKRERQRYIDCYHQMVQDGHADKGRCGGMAGGDKNTDYLSYECVGCPFMIWTDDWRNKDE